MTPILQFAEVSFGFPGRPVLHKASFELEPGTATAVVGPNGAGKTTLLRLASGVARPRSGAVWFQGRPLSEFSTRDVARVMAVVPQILEVPFDLTVQQVVEQGRTPHTSLLGSLSRADQLAVDRALDQAQATLLRNRIFNELSGGERQRVKIALALAQQPRLLLLDEPTQNLDIGRQAELLKLLADLRQSGLTIVATLHELHLIAGNFSSVILLRPGVTPIVGPPEKILSPEVIASTFSCALEHPILDRYRKPQWESAIS
jgi:iron complex transport system ATP-binding protein